MASQYASKKNEDVINKTIEELKTITKKQIKEMESSLKKNKIKTNISSHIGMIQAYLYQIKSKLTGEEYIKDCKGAPWKISGEAMDIGTKAHDMISEFHIAENDASDKGNDYGRDEAKAWFHTRLLETKDIDKDSKKKLSHCIDSFLKWREEVNFVVVGTEFTVYSDFYRYAGTVDALGYVNGIMTLVDYKTSKGIWPEYDLQIASYMHALREMYESGLIKLEEPATQMMIVNFTKEGELETKTVGNFDVALKAFLGLREAFVNVQIWEASNKLSLAKDNQS